MHEERHSTVAGSFLLVMLHMLSSSGSRTPTLPSSALDTDKLAGLVYRQYRTYSRNCNKSRQNSSIVHFARERPISRMCWRIFVDDNDIALFYTQPQISQTSVHIVRELCHI